jgi:hypothetical protein
MVVLPEKSDEPGALRTPTWSELRPVTIGLLASAVIAFTVWDAVVPRSSQNASYAFDGGLIAFVLLFTVVNIRDPGFARTAENSTFAVLRLAGRRDYFPVGGPA